MIVRSILNARWVSSSPPGLSGQTDPASAQQLDRSDRFCSITGHFKTSITRQLDSIVFALRTAEAVAAKISPKMAQTSTPTERDTSEACSKPFTSAQHWRTIEQAAHPFTTSYRLKKAQAPSGKLARCSRLFVVILFALPFGNTVEPVDSTSLGSCGQKCNARAWIYHTLDGLGTALIGVTHSGHIALLEVEAPFSQGVWPSPTPRGSLRTSGLTTWLRCT